MSKLSRAIAGLLVAGLAACSATRVKESESYVQPADGILLHYRLLEGGPDVLVIPGESALGPDLERLAKGRTVLFYDPRGRGRSTVRGMVRLPEDLGDLEAVLDWFHFERVTLLGTQYNAALVALFAAEHPERVERLVLASPLPARKDPYWAILERVYNDRLDSAEMRELTVMKRQGVSQLEKERWREAYLQATFRGLVVDPRSLDRIKSPHLAEGQSPEAYINQYLDLLRSLGDWDWRKQLASIACPTLVVCGAADPMPAVATAEWATTIPKAELVSIDGSARLPWIERPRDFFGAVETFLDR